MHAGRMAVACMADMGVLANGRHAGQNKVFVHAMGAMLQPSVELLLLTSSRLQTMVPSGMVPMGLTLPTCSVAFLPQ